MSTYWVTCHGGPADGFEISLHHIPSARMPTLVGMPVPAPNGSWYKVHAVEGRDASAFYDGERTIPVPALDED